MLRACLDLAKPAALMLIAAAVLGFGLRFFFGVEVLQEHLCAMAMLGTIGYAVGGEAVRIAAHSAETPPHS